MPRLVLGAELGAQPEPVRTGQVQADHDQVEAPRAALLERLGGAGRTLDPMAGIGQEPGQPSGQQVLALDHQDLAVAGVRFGILRHLAGDIQLVRGGVAHP